MKTLTYACVAIVLVIAGAGPSLLSAQTPAPSLAKEIAAGFQRASTDILDVAEVMPADKYGYKPTPEMSSFGEQLVHVAGITQRFMDTAISCVTGSPCPAALFTAVLAVDRPFIWKGAGPKPRTMKVPFP